MLKDLSLDDNPYFNPLNELNKISSLRNPRDKLNCLLMMMSSLKSEIVNFHSCKVELESMDD